MRPNKKSQKAYPSNDWKTTSRPSDIPRNDSFRTDKDFEAQKSQKFSLEKVRFRSNFKIDKLYFGLSSNYITYINYLYFSKTLRIEC